MQFWFHKTQKLVLSSIYLFFSTLISHILSLPFLPSPHFLFHAFSLTSLLFPHTHTHSLHRNGNRIGEGTGLTQ
ncbi:hypothetical protein RJT34_31716 [Clitoria ternatea]|uniref:Uncharacterized protein n=1 Tax=Clitoria ternatea TaxID=43366 RepID=A0AAN9I336_CLITE